MSSLLGIIVIIIIFSVVKKSVSTGTNSSNKNSTSYSGSSSTLSSTSSGTSGATSAYGSGTSSSPRVIGGNYSVPTTTGGRPVSANRTNTQSSYSKPSSATQVGQKTTANTESSDRVEKSTMDYLQEKAQADQLEHAKEKYEEQKRVDSVAGRKPAAGRYLIGDPIPKGCRLIECPYCAAENVVPVMYYGDKSCYFCRTHLK